jgi:hypothetical protein
MCIVQDAMSQLIAKLLLSCMQLCCVYIHEYTIATRSMMLCESLPHACQAFAITALIITAVAPRALSHFHCIVLRSIVSQVCAVFGDLKN